MKPPFVYFGGKQMLAERIVGLLPPHRHYVEPFAGSLAVLLAKPPVEHETVNDLDGDIVTFWRVLRESPGELERLCLLTPCSRAEYETSRHRPADLTDLERARRVWVTLTQGRGATPRNSGWRHYAKPSGGAAMGDYLRGYVSRIAPAADRLQRVQLECRPALEIIATYGQHRDVLLYVDPPYLGEARSTAADPRRATKRYQHEMLDAAQHQELLAALETCRATVVLSGYPSALYDDRLTDWCRVEIPTATGQSARGEWSARTEVLWSNRPFEMQASLLDEEVSV